MATAQELQTNTDANNVANYGANTLGQAPNIPVSQITPTQPINLGTPAPDSSASLLGTTNNAINYVNNLSTQATTAEQNVNNSQSDITSTMNALLGKTADTQTANESSGLNSATKQLADLNAQGQSLNREASAIPIKTAESFSNTGATDAGIAPVNASALRQNALKALSIAQQADVATANYTAAKDKAQQMIDLKYQPLEQKLALQQQQYQFNKDALTAVNAKKAEALGVALKKQESDLATQKKTESDNVTALTGWAKSAMDSNQPKLSAQISALDPASPTFKQDLAVLQAKITPNTSLDSQYKQMQIAELAQKISDAKKVTDLGGSVTPVAQLPDGTYDTATQDALLAKMSPSDAALVKAVGNYTMDIAKVTSLRSDQRQLLAQKVAMVYPGFDMTNYATHAAYRKSLASTAQGTAGGAINSANKVINHLTSFIDNVNKLSNTAIGGGIGELINSTKNNLISVVSPAKQQTKAEAQTDATGVKDELAKFFKGSGVADVHTIEDWSKTVNVDASPASQRGAVQGAIELLQGQLVPMIDQYKQVMGTPPPDGLFLKADTQAKLSNLKNQGFKIDIPGVNYTDKSAWMKYGGGTQDTWNNAVDALTKAGLPLTNENILQASQIQ